jgi:hypothetical protein
MLDEKLYPTEERRRREKKQRERRATQTKAHPAIDKKKTLLSPFSTAHYNDRVEFESIEHIFISLRHPQEETHSLTAFTPLSFPLPPSHTLPSPLIALTIFAPPFRTIFSCLSHVRLPHPYWSLPLCMMNHFLGSHRKEGARVFDDGRWPGVTRGTHPRHRTPINFAARKANSRDGAPSSCGCPA